MPLQPGTACVGPAQCGLGFAGGRAHREHPGQHRGVQAQAAGGILPLFDRDGFPEGGDRGPQITLNQGDRAAKCRPRGQHRLIADALRAVAATLGRDAGVGQPAGEQQRIAASQPQVRHLGADRVAVFFGEGRAAVGQRDRGPGPAERGLCDDRGGVRPQALVHRLGFVGGDGQRDVERLTAAPLEDLDQRVRDGRGVEHRPRFPMPGQTPVEEPCPGRPPGGRFRTVGGKDREAFVGPAPPPQHVREERTGVVDTGLDGRAAQPFGQRQVVSGERLPRGLEEDRAFRRRAGGQPPCRAAQQIFLPPPGKRAEPGGEGAVDLPGGDRRQRRAQHHAVDRLAEPDEAPPAVPHDVEQAGPLGREQPGFGFHQPQR